MDLSETERLLHDLLSELRTVHIAECLHAQERALKIAQDANAAMATRLQGMEIRLRALLEQ